jgi:1L-myo-inositol 1-phosphate cytidylyltransferase
MEQRPLPAVILAAGQGHRLLESSRGLPKPLMPVLGVPLLERTILSCRAAGIPEVFVVLGYRQDLLIPAITELARRYEMAIRAVANPLWEEGNGTSALAAAPFLHRPFFLLMCDHVFEPEMLDHLRAAADDADVSCSGSCSSFRRKEPLREGRSCGAGARDPGADVCRLAVDRRVGEIFDPPDATKVRLNGQTITAIGKDIAPFDAVDTGLFLCRPVLFEALERARAQGDSSLSGGMRQLLSASKLQAVDIGAHFWSDVDTPASLVYTERMLQARLAASREILCH